MSASAPTSDKCQSLGRSESSAHTIRLAFGENGDDDFRTAPRGRPSGSATFAVQVDGDLDAAGDFRRVIREALQWILLT